ncbi:MAG TPA: cytochrome P450 [Myxococcales bacterium]|nr:cytochrome P450 [Myxococcales bacterium]
MTTAAAATLPAPADLAAARTAPGPRGRFILGSTPEFRSDPLDLLSRVVREHGDVVKLNLVKTAFVVAHPDGVRHVLHDHHLKYKKNFVYDRLQPLLGNGLVTSGGDFWKRQRRLAQPAFHRQRIQGFAQMMAARTGRMLERWKGLAAGRKPFDVHEEMTRLTFGIIGDALFSLDLEEGAAEVGEALAEALEITQRSFTALVYVPRSIPTPENLRFARAKKVLDRLVDEIIEKRRAAPDAGHDLLGMLMAARDEDTGEAMDNRQLKDEVLTMALAGHETTANALTWTFSLLSRHPEIARRVQQEARTARWPNLRYTQQVIEESMRLYPPAWIFGREALVDDVIQGFLVPRGSTVMLSPYVTHRHRDFWENPEGFDPDRFAPEQAQGRHRYAYFPFAAGPRMCIGDSFARMEMPIILSLVAERYAVHLEPGFVPELDPVVTLRPGNGMWVTAKEVVAGA